MPDLVSKFQGETFHVLMTEEVDARFRGTDARMRARCERIMQKFATDGPMHFNETQFKPEERLSIGDKSGTEAMIYAFKAYQLRVYGSYGAERGQFICTEIVVDKKDDKADRTVLKSAAKKLRPYLKKSGKG